MKLVKTLWVALFLQLGILGSGWAQQITYSGKNIPLQNLFTEISRQTGYFFAYKPEVMELFGNIDLDVKKASLREVLDLCCNNSSLSYSIVNRVVILQRRTAASGQSLPAYRQVSGQVLDENNEPMAGATISASGKHRAISRNNGWFTASVENNVTRLTVSSVGYEDSIITLEGNNPVKVQLKASVRGLDETLVIGYGRTSQRLNTGSVARVSYRELVTQPVTDPLAAMQGRVPGLLITQSNGFPGASFKVQLRGQSSIGITPGQLPPNDPLFVIDGVPFAPGNLSLQLVASGSVLNAGRSPLNNISLDDIESIEILKDADATAIYGSRGANGVVLITTRRGSEGKATVAANVYTGFSHITRSVDMLNTQQYLQMRREALQNDGTTPTIANAPDLLVWDTTRYTDFNKLLIGGTAQRTHAHASVSGGSASTQYYISGGYHRETTVLPGNMADKRGNFNTRINYLSANKKLKAAMSAMYTADDNNLIVRDVTSDIVLPPNAPPLYDANGKLNWQEGGVSFNNPLAFLQQPYRARTNNLFSSLQLSYRLIKGLLLKTDAGYNYLHSREHSLLPSFSQNPAGAPQGYSFFGCNRFKSWIVEPQAEYTFTPGAFKITTLVGGTWQELTNDAVAINATGFSSDEHLQDTGAAGNLLITPYDSRYRYHGVFARAHINLRNKYLLHLTGRRDGSSRFGPSRQFGTFYAAGAAWIFSGEQFISKKLPFISFGKLRASYGKTGNDQIGDYKYMDQWREAQYAYLGNPGYIPIQLADSSYSWEENRKLEAALELGLLKDRIFLSVAYYHNRSGNQLIAYNLPAITGFNRYAAKNSPALVQNTGVEIIARVKNSTRHRLQWFAELTMTIPRNKLLSFPGLATSSYASTLVVGQSLSVQRGFRYTGVDPSTGIFSFEDVDRDGSISFPNDYRVLGHLDPKFFGSLQHSISYNGWLLEGFIELRKQTGYNIREAIYKFDESIPGVVLRNQPVMVLNRWQQPGDVAYIQQLTATTGSTAFGAINKFRFSDGELADASFIRLKNVSLSYQLPRNWLNSLHIKEARLYILAQNLLTISGYEGPDPETQNMLTLPPLRTIAVGLRLGF